MRMVGAYQRIEEIADKGSFVEWFRDLKTQNVLHVKGYMKKIKDAQAQTGLVEAVVAGKARIGGEEAVLCVCDAAFLMGSMGCVVGEKITRAVERAAELGLAVVIFCCSGGARMQEGVLSLMQMEKTAAALCAHSDKGLFSVTVLTHPTTGGVTASFAMLGDVILAEPGAMVGFAGPRVIEQTTGYGLPDGFQTSEFQLGHGMVDAVVPRGKLKGVLHSLLFMNRKGSGYADFGRAAGCADCVGPDGQADGMCSGKRVAGHADRMDFGKQVAGHADRMDFGKQAVRHVKGMSFGDKMAGGVMSAFAARLSPKRRLSAWDRLKAIRGTKRACALDFVPLIFDGFMELKGDRLYGDDKAIVGGIAMLDGQPVTLIVGHRGREAGEMEMRNYGMPMPEGYRKALRLMKQAEKFHRPIITFVNTPGAYPGIGAEERGQGGAIARNLFEMSHIKVPILSIIVGEGGSGGALAAAVGNEVWMLENAVYSVISPEGYASIVWKDASRAAEAAEKMHITAGDLKKLGVVDRVIPEYGGATMQTAGQISACLKYQIKKFLAAMSAKSPEEIVAERYQRFRRM